MRGVFPGAGLLLVCVMSVQSIDAQEAERAKAAAEAVKGVYGTSEGLTQNGVRPLSTPDPMRTVDGRQFTAQMNCPATQRFLRVTIMPSGTSDIARIDVELDRDLNGSAETGRSFTGPFAGVCNNGVIRCDAGTWNNCHAFRWTTSDGVPILDEVPQTQLGACYCVNASCGANLLMVNSNKVVSDVGGSVMSAVQQLLPRLTTARAQSDELSIAYFGQSSGCGADRSPEQYFSHPQDLAAAGIAAGRTSGTVANFLLGTSVAAERGINVLSCQIQRQIETTFVPKSDILRLVSSTRGTLQDCGPGCLRLIVGDQTYTTYRGGGFCRNEVETQQYLVGDPERIESVTIRRAVWDDAIRLWIDRSIAHSSVSGWTAAGPPGPFCGQGNHDQTMAVDLTGRFARTGSVNVAMDVAHDIRGEGWYEIEARVREGCEIGREDIIDGCTAAAANPDCALAREVVDGIETVRDFRTTGLSPLPSSRPVGSACQLDSGVRTWWVTQREYRCRTREPGPDMSAVEDRYRTIHETIDPASGAFTDRRTTASGVQISSEQLALPTASAPIGCTRMCRTRRPRPGVAVAEGNPQSALNPTGVPYDFTFKECDESNRCPLEPGEEISSPCDCRSNFAQAAAMMQTIRTVQGDTVCTAP